MSKLTELIRTDADVNEAVISFIAASCGGLGIVHFKIPLGTAEVEWVEDRGYMLRMTVMHKDGPEQGLKIEFPVYK